MVRRARPALGTIVELGVQAADADRASVALQAAWKTLVEVEQALSTFDPRSDVARFNAAAAGITFAITDHTAAVLELVADLQRVSDGLFDATLGTGPLDWFLVNEGGQPAVQKRSTAVRLDLGGVGKGYAVDRTFEALAVGLGSGDDAACWVNAGGDLRVGAADLPVFLRNEEEGGAVPWLFLRDGALATSCYGPTTRARLAGASREPDRHVSVASPRCMWSDALTKIVALTGCVNHLLLARYRAVAWIHSKAGGCP
jgi:thiamine biosynthesis lipoprotein